MSAIVGNFEFHITVSGDDAARLAAWAGERGVKFTHIVLARGETVSQPMLTVRAEGTTEAVLADAEAMAGELREMGFRVTRVKVESSPFADGVPATAEQAAVQPADRYFEHHLKLLLPLDLDEAALADLVTPHGAHLSRNARRVREDGRAERFVTQRCHRVGTDSAVADLDRLIETLRDAGHEMVSVEREYVVYDSSPAVDTGWIG
jgi:hypothetical protein